MNFAEQLEWLFILSIPVACISWTVTHEDIFKEPREFCIRCSKEKKYLLTRKFYYLFTCEYCFSHYVTIAFLFLTHYKLLLTGCRGYIIAGFSIVWIANVYMALFALIRMDIKNVKADINIKEDEI